MQKVKFESLHAPDPRKITWKSKRKLYFLCVWKN